MAALELLALNESTPQIVAPQTGDTAKLPITLQAATGNEIAYDLQYTVNKATSGDDTGLLINQTDTASPGTSLLADFQVAGVTKFKVSNAGQLTLLAGLTVTGAVLGSSDIRSGAANFHYWSGRTQIGAPSDGVLELINFAANDFGRIQLGGTTSSFPALKRSAAKLQAVLADDSGFAQFDAKNIELDRTTEDAAFTNFKATIDADAISAISSLTNSGAVTHHVQIELNGTTAWIPVSTIDPS